MNVLGLDLALGRSGWAVLDYELGDLVDFGSVTTDPKTPTVERISGIVAAVRRVITTENLCDVAIEDGWAGRNGTTTRRLAGVWWAVATTVWDATGIEPAPVQPSEIKRLACGRGDAAKGEVTLAALNRWGITDADIGDAAWCAEVLRLRLHTHYDREGTS